MPQVRARCDVVPALTVATRPEGEWNELEIMLQGSHLRATLNGTVVQDLNFDEVEELRYRLGRIYRSAGP